MSDALKTTGKMDMSAWSLGADREEEVKDLFLTVAADMFDSAFEDVYVDFGNRTSEGHTPLEVVVWGEYQGDFQIIVNVPTLVDELLADLAEGPDVHGDKLAGKCADIRDALRAEADRIDAALKETETDDPDYDDQGNLKPGVDHD